jgi:hypothetical protein
MSAGYNLMRDAQKRADFKYAFGVDFDEANPPPTPPTTTTTTTTRTHIRSFPDDDDNDDLDLDLGMHLDGRHRNVSGSMGRRVDNVDDDVDDWKEGLSPEDIASIMRGGGDTSGPLSNSSSNSSKINSVGHGNSNNTTSNITNITNINNSNASGITSSSSSSKSSSKPSNPDLIRSRSEQEAISSSSFDSLTDQQLRCLIDNNTLLRLTNPSR